MKVRKLKKNELPEAYLISAYCFHVRTDDVEAEIRKIDASNRVDWGAFDDDGTLMARIISMDARSRWAGSGRFRHYRNTATAGRSGRSS